MIILYVTVEKGSLLALAMMLIAAGVERALADNVEVGFLLIALGLMLLFAREYLKLHRWHRTSRWRGEWV